MAKYRIKQEVEAITFEEFVQHGIASGCPIINGMPWSFSYKGNVITHENDKCYLLPKTGSPHSYRFTPDDMLITDANGDVYPCNTEVFKMAFMENDGEAE